MFQSATLKLTGWYLLIIMAVSLLFSVLVFQTASNELATRLMQFGSDLPGEYQTFSQLAIRQLRVAQTTQATHNILMNLIYINILLLLAGGGLSYLMARRTLRPIEEAHEAQSRFVSDASHELRTPLTVMKTELEVALRTPSLTSKELRALLESNLEEVNSLTRLSTTLLSLSKLDYASLVHEMIPFQETVRTVVKRYQKTSPRITLREKGKPLTIDAHQPSIDELLTILIDNALKYSPDNSPVTVTLAKQNNKASLKITNTGKGITQKDLPFIFDRFYQAQNARTHTHSSGFGLGLSLAKKIVELHSGDLSASSAPNKRTTFTVLLPIVKKGTIQAPVSRG